MITAEYENYFCLRAIFCLSCDQCCQTSLGLEVYRSHSSGLSRQLIYRAACVAFDPASDEVKSVVSALM